MNARIQGRLRARLRGIGLGVALWCCAVLPAAALVVSAGTPLATAPSYLGTALGAGQFPAPEQATGTVDLQDGRFDLRDGDQVVQRIGGPFDQGVHGAAFNSAQPDRALRPAVGFSFSFSFPGFIDHVAGFFSGGVQGDGVLARVAFEYLANHAGLDPDLSVDTPEPATAWLLAGALAALLSLRPHVRAPGLLAARLETTSSPPRQRA
ncbi:hypothetical protein [Pseudorhodoferax sp. Leaf274]|uniref:hypothetical protein n=1 Tax=Pseudorhodoferax sp. Leaf274 TaxID=1736318 RepID=UPI0007027F9E|nr:hypothetical protein [Pseudorhodoferax sp. Leaf274]KQP39949.1 hypothetical protein ASF44_09585 [Pseudorhodoferax sp. Leaf274]